MFGLSLHRIIGTRDSRGVNRKEADAVCASVAELIKREKSGDKVSTIGVLSPFRDQVEFLERRLIKELALSDIQRHQLRVGTAYSFQGDERDVMFLSLAVDDESHGTAFSYLQRADVFNVSITRARHRQIIFYSFDPRNRGKDLVRNYLEQQFHPAPARQVAESSGMMSEVVRALTKKGCACLADLRVGGIPIDLAIGLNGRWIGLDLIRANSADTVLSLDELRLLERAGFTVFPVGEREWQIRPDRLLSVLAKLIEK